MFYSRITARGISALLLVLAICFAPASLTAQSNCPLNVDVSNEDCPGGLTTSYWIIDNDCRCGVTVEIFDTDGEKHRVERKAHERGKLRGYAYSCRNKKLEIASWRAEYHCPPSVSRPSPRSGGSQQRSAPPQPPRAYSTEAERQALIDACRAARRCHENYQEGRARCKASSEDPYVCGNPHWLAYMACSSACTNAYPRLGN